MNNFSYRFYLTFGQNSPGRNGYELVESTSYECARAMVIQKYGQQWANIYAEKDFDFQLFPKGCLGVIK